MRPQQVAGHLAHGGQPTRTDIADLVAYATGAMSMAQSPDHHH
jgi:hypothetical protein